jgi:hypothetical protein
MVGVGLTFWASSSFVVSEGKEEKMGRFLLGYFTTTIL